MIRNINYRVTHTTSKSERTGYIIPFLIVVILLLSSCGGGGGSGDGDNGDVRTDFGSWGAAELFAGESDNSSVDNVSIAINAAGNAVALWIQKDLTGDSAIDENARVNTWAKYYLVGSGWGAAKLIEINDDGDVLIPKVAIDADGNALAVWSQYDGDRDKIDTKINLWANRYSAGDWGNAVLLATGDDIGTGSLSIVMDTAGNAMATWPQGNPSSIWVNRYIKAVGWDVAESIETSNAITGQPHVAMDAAGNAMAVWNQDDSGQPSVWANRYTAGSGWGTEELLETGGGRIYNPHIAINAAGNAFAVWRQDDGTRGRIRANRYSIGSGWGTPELIDSNASTTWGHPKIAIDDNGNALAVWEQSDSSGISAWANRYSAGSWGVAELIEDNTFNLSDLHIAMNASGHAFAVWRQFGPPAINIWSNRYTVDNGWATAESIDTSIIGPGISGSVSPQIAIDASGDALAAWSRQIELEKDSDTYNNTIQANRFE